MQRPFARALAALFPTAFLLPLAAQSPSSSSVPAGGPRGAVPRHDFTDVTAFSGIGLANELTESLAWGDYDHDADEDLYLTINGANRLFRNDGAGRFTDVTAVTGTTGMGFSVGTAFGDLDNDGDLDLYVVTFGSGSDLLYRNDGPVGPGGEFVFTDVTAAAGLVSQQSSRGMALLDYDQDGLLDVYVNAIGPNILYRNLGGLVFSDVAPALGVDANDTGVGTVCSDVDQNGWIDIWTGNRSFDPNRLYLNSGGSFSDATAAAGIDAVGPGMGVLAFDYDNDLDMDLYWTTWPSATNVLYENLDGTTFADVTAQSGTADPLGWGISGNAGDFDQDGWMDFFVTNGFDPSTTPNVLFHNRGDGTFEDATAELAGGADFDGRGAAFADFDGDLDLDLCVTADAGEPNRLWRNDTPGGNHGLTLVLEGTRSNRSAIGARVEVTAGGQTTVQEVSGGAGRGSFNSLPLEFGLGTASRADTIVIRWRNGKLQSLSNVAADQRLEVLEP